MCEWGHVSVCVCVGVGSLVSVGHCGYSSGQDCVQMSVRVQRYIPVRLGLYCVSASACMSAWVSVLVSDRDACGVLAKYTTSSPIL